MWGEVIAAGASVLGGALGSSAASKASSAQQKAANKAASLQYQMYQQGRQDLAPQRYVGNQALNVLARTYGLDPYTTQYSAAPTPYNMANMSNSQQKALNKALERLGPNYDLNSLSGKQRKAVNKVTKALGYNPFTPQGVALQGNHVLPGGSAFNQAAGGSALPAGNAAGAYTTANPVTGVGSPQSATIYTDPQAPNPTAGTYEYFYASPDYKFRMDESMKAINADAAARGLRNSGAQIKGTLDYAGNLAAGEFGNWYNRMSNLAGMGQVAGSQTANMGQSYGANAGNAMISAGDARASGYMGQANSWGNAISGVGNALGGYLGSRSNAVSTRGGTNSGVWDYGPRTGEIDIWAGTRR